MARIISPDMIPKSLWDNSKETLTLPHAIIDCWKKLLGEKDLLKEATENNFRGEIGGIDEEATHKHYSFNYNGSCARFQLAFLDPKEDLKEVSDAFVKSLAGYNVFITDIPSGTGAASLSLLCNIAQLREENIFPLIPLNIEILAGEISKSAIVIFQESFNEIKEYLEEHEIYVQLHTEIWDVTDDNSTLQLINKITSLSQETNDKILLLANFTGFLEKEGKWNDVKGQFEKLFNHFSGKSTIAIWLEPKYKISFISFFPKAIKWFKNKFKKLVGSTEDIKIETSQASFNHGLIDVTSRTSVAVVRFNTERI
ncbi:hypothetical protein QWY81_08000 [Polaribacter undariae]|uniref:Uncharacterized protein n=1 Tax=Polaribacter sejongensis TaxID=985043 RepID=A0AAJ1VGA0_9FLAO|nr:hypothetical protein [Polaribacter undariae]MDN3619391.1 hypothetical protein [Polaribacter undariae]UWD33409.1 hypothetical protein NQP51_06965 [Polaribacter undariae]